MGHGESPGFVRLADLSDVRVYAIANDGSETLIRGVQAVSFKCSGNEAATVCLRVLNPEIDVEGTGPRDWGDTNANEGGRHD